MAHCGPSANVSWHNDRCPSRLLYRHCCRSLDPGSWLGGTAGMIHGRTRGSALTEVSPFMLLSVPVIVTSILWLTTPNPVELPAVGYAFCLLLFPWGSYVAW